jgi:hypothetical protein
VDQKGLDIGDERYRTALINGLRSFVSFSFVYGTGSTDSVFFQEALFV